MGFYSNVQVVAERKAFDFLKPVFEKHWPYADVGECDKYGSFALNWVKWYDDFVEVKETERAMRSIMGEEYDDKEGWGFKCICLNEDDTHWELCNLRGDSKFYDFEVVAEIRNPWNLGGEIKE